jgi:hypothetical protein
MFIGNSHNQGRRAKRLHAQRSKRDKAWAACHAEVCLRLRCLATLLRCPNSIPQCSHTYGRAPVFVFMCSLRLLAVEYALPHLPPPPPHSPVSAGRLRSKQGLLHGARGAQARTPRQPVCAERPPVQLAGVRALTGVRAHMLDEVLASGERARAKEAFQDAGAAQGRRRQA